MVKIPGPTLTVTAPSLFRVCICLLAAALSQRAQAAENTRTGIFHEQCRTLTVIVDGNPQAPPVITLADPPGTLTVGFDMLGDEREYLRYSIYHCNADWSISNLTDMEVFDGFNLADITDYAFSRATSVHYVHYSISLPNDEFRFRLSGNYLLRVYPENDPEEIYLQVRFMVSETAANIRGQVDTATDIDYNDAHQQLSFTVDLANNAVRDPFNDLKVIVSQNNRTDNSVQFTHPTRMSGSSAVYEHIPKLIFPAGNEYRRMETVQITYPGMGVEDIEYHAPYYHHLLKTDTPRHSRPYAYDQTQHGRFLVREYNATDPDTEADYTVVHFTLEMLPLPDAEVYLEGDLTGRRLDESSRMIYDTEAGAYRKALLLKQGAYNYQYLAAPHARAGKAFAGSTAQVEGDKFQTVNEYEIAVYYREPSERYDRLLGYTLLFSDH